MESAKTTAATVPTMMEGERVADGGAFFWSSPGASDVFWTSSSEVGVSMPYSTWLEILFSCGASIRRLGNRAWRHWMHKLFPSSAVYGRRAALALRCLLFVPDFRH